MAPDAPAPRASALADRLIDASLALTSLIERIEAGAWRRLSAPGVWSPSKDAEHVADANVYHQWIVRITIGEAKSSSRPRIERDELTSARSPAEVIELVHRTLDDAATLVRGLTDVQLDLVTKPPRAGAASLAQTIERVMIDHVALHHAAIEAKLRLA
jgi:DinB superfamily